MKSFCDGVFNDIRIDGFMGYRVTWSLRGSLACDLFRGFHLLEAFAL